jgi:predicted phosphohydrolase
MRNPIIATFTLLFLLSCSHRKTLTEQLTATFTAHLQRIDSLATLDSVQVRWKVPVTERLTRIIDDSVYMREYSRLRAQLTSALRKQDKDTIEFYQYEINYMEQEIDSISKSIEKGDTTRRFGVLIGCGYSIAKNGRSKYDSTLIFIDSASTIRFTEFMDSAIRRTVGSFN